MKYEVHLSLGSNLDRERNYPAAVALLGTLGEIQRVSSVYDTVPVGMEPDTPAFFNGAVMMITDLEPEVFKQGLRDEVEAPLGRDRPAGTRWVSRTIDVDIALWGNMVGDIAGRRVPDPDILRYLHVAVPLAEISNNMVHPENRRTLGDIAANLVGTGPLPTPRTDIILEF